MKLLLTVQGEAIAPRFDQTVEVVIVDRDGASLRGEPRWVLLPRRNAGELSDLILREGVDCVICGGIEDTYHAFLTWKKIQVIDNIIGPFAEALEMSADGRLEPGRVLPSATANGQTGYHG